MILTVKVKTRHHVEGQFGSEFPAICNHCVVMTACRKHCRGTVGSQSDLVIVLVCFSQISGGIVSQVLAASSFKARETHTG